MARVYRPESGSKLRKKLMRHMAGALQEGRSQDISTVAQWDVCAYLAACLAEIDKTVEQTTEAWERRGYWVKADRFRMEWSWVGSSKDELDRSLAAAELASALKAAAGLVSPLKGIEPYSKDGNKKPWRGSWQAWRSNG